VFIEIGDNFGFDGVVSWMMKWSTLHQLKKKDLLILIRMM
jgi:hypothetical protein